MVSATLKAEAAASARSAHAGRKRYWILPGLQMRMILWGVAVTALMATVAAWVVLLVVWPSFGSRFVWTSSGPNMDELFRDACMRVFLTTGLLVLIFGVIAFVTGLFVSHKIAGPVYRVRQVARRIAQGQPGQRVVLRRRDYMLDFVDDFNRMLEYLEGRLQRQQAALDKVETHLGELESLAGQSCPSHEDVEACLRDARATLREMNIERIPETAT